MRIFFSSLPQAKPTAAWQKIVAVLVFLGMLALAFTLSVVLLPILLLIVAWFWWKTRAVRRQWRDMQAQMQRMRDEVERAQAPQQPDGDIIEGEVVSVKISTVREER